MQDFLKQAEVEVRYYRHQLITDGCGSDSLCNGQWNWTYAFYAQKLAHAAEYIVLQKQLEKCSTPS